MALTRITTSELSNNVVASFANVTAFAELSSRVDSLFATANTANTNASGVVPKITNVQIANSSYTVLDDTAVNVGGGYIVVTGTGFELGSTVLVDVTLATSTTFVNSTTLRAQVPAKSAATYNLYVVNTDGGTATKVNGVTYSSTPTWVTGSTLANVSSNTAFTGNISATGATSYANTTSLPTGFNLVTANGYYFGNISVGSDTTYSFTVEARDAENQESSRTFSLSAIATVPLTVEYLVIAGGASGAPWAGGGGGAGGYRTASGFSVTPGTTYTVTVGAGGASQTNKMGNGNNGSASVFSTITSAGGGYGGNGGSVNTEGGPGGSGGGGGTSTANSRAGGSGNVPSTTPSQGNNGGASSSANDGTGGGGGGAGGAGGTPTGGSGSSSSITGTSVARAGGGGGCGPGGTSVSAGGGAGGAGPSPGSNGTVNTGGGGGGARNGDGVVSGAGGSGIVIIRYADTFPAASTTGSPTVTTSGGFRIYQFTGSGSITW